jgi:excisionase family DNA binding protein
MGLCAAEAAEIIGVTCQTVYKLVHSGALPKQHKRQRSGLDREAVERAGLARVPARDGHPYFLTVIEAAEVLSVSPERVRQLASRGRLPVVEHDGRRLFRRPQLDVVANARQARKGALRSGT